MTNSRRRRLLALFSIAAASAATALLFKRLSGRSNAAALAPVAAAPHAIDAADARFAQALRLSGTQGLLAGLPLSQALELTATVGAFALFPGAKTALWHYAARIGQREIANPLLRIARGDSIDVTLVNRLDEATTIHWHGLSVDEANDGSGLHPVAAGESNRYQLRVDNRAGLYWYHAHPHGRTGAQLQHGLAGLLLVDDDESRALAQGLGLVWGERDLPLMIADKQIDAGNAIVYKQRADDWIGNRAVVNWTPEPYLDVQPALYRFRLINVANARMLRPAFIHRGQPLPMQLIGTDGGLLEKPWTIEDLFLAPAQRVDVLVDFSAVPAGEQVMLRSLEYVAMENEDESGAFAPDPMGDHPGAMAMGEALDLMLLRIVQHAPAFAAAQIPQRLSQLPPPPDTQGWPVRAFRLRMDTEGRWFINDWNFLLDGHRTAFEVKRGTREVWEIRNSMTSMPHPIHLHGFQFRVVSRSISPPDIRARQVAPGGLTAQDLGLNDTVVVWPGEIVRIALDFSQPFRGPQRYMLHCHNLEHEDMGMMVTFAVVD